MNHNYLEQLSFLDTNVCHGCPYELNDEDCQKCGCKALRDKIMNAIEFAEKHKIHRDKVPDNLRSVLVHYTKKVDGQWEDLSTIGFYYNNAWFTGSGNLLKDNIKVLGWREIPSGNE